MKLRNTASRKQTFSPTCAGLEFAHWQITNATNAWECDFYTVGNTDE
jgi:hypothetical protein